MAAPPPLLLLVLALFAGGSLSASLHPSLPSSYLHPLHLSRFLASVFCFRSCDAFLFLCAVVLMADCLSELGLSVVTAHKGAEGAASSTTIGMLLALLHSPSPSFSSVSLLPLVRHPFNNTHALFCDRVGGLSPFFCTHETFFMAADSRIVCIRSPPSPLPPPSHHTSHTSLTPPRTACLSLRHVHRTQTVYRWEVFFSARDVAQLFC